MGWGQNWTPITPQLGSKLHAGSHAVPHLVDVDLDLDNGNIGSEHPG